MASLTCMQCWTDPIDPDYWPYCSVTCMQAAAPTGWDREFDEERDLDDFGWFDQWKAADEERWEMDRRDAHTSELERRYRHDH